MDFVGMDTDQGLGHVERLRTAARQLESRHAALSSTVQASHAFWRGPDAEAFRTTWADGAGRLLTQLVGELGQSASSLDGEVAEQETASAGETTGSGAGEDGNRGGAGPGIPGARYGGGGDGTVSPEVARAWDAMGPEDQRQVLQEIVDQELERQGHPGLDVHFEDLSDEGWAGYWTEHGGIRFWRGEHIVIDIEHATDPDALNTAAHEARHAAQDQWVEQTDGTPGWQFWREDDSAEEYERIERDHGVTQEEIEAWRENDGDYISPPEPPPSPDAPQSEHDAWHEAYREYREQPLEDDAFDTGDDFADEITLEELQQYQEDAQVTVTS